MFTKTSGSKRFTSGFSRFLAHLFHFKHVQCDTRVIRLRDPSTFVFTFFVQYYQQCSHIADGKTITSII
jgi:hypothetical protein